jgi:hypothetical protein
MVRPQGEIKAAWACRSGSLAGGITYSITVPVGVSSRLHLPVVAGLSGGSNRTQVAESGAVVFDGTSFVPAAAQGVVAAALATDGLSVVIETLSGSYSFVTGNSRR